MEKYQSEEVQETVNWEMYHFEEYITGYKLYKQLKKKWSAYGKEEASDDLQ